MATNDAEFALTALRGLKLAGVEFGVLHGATDLQESDQRGDVDLVVKSHSSHVLRTVNRTWRERGIYPVAMWNYDVPGSAGLFLMDRRATRGVQLDLLYDPNGDGRYGLRTNSIRIQPGELPSVDSLDELVYLFAKRSIKGPTGALADISKVIDRNRPEFEKAVRRIVVHPVLRKRLGMPLPPITQARRTVRRIVLQLQRVLNRATSPVGYWSHVADRKVAESLANRFQEILGHSLVTPSPSGPLRTLRWIITEVAPVRFRPGVVVSYGVKSRFAEPDLLVMSDDPNNAAAEIVEAMSNRLCG
jgi:hypothetical protein